MSFECVCLCLQKLDKKKDSSGQVCDSDTKDPDFFFPTSNEPSLNLSEIKGEMRKEMRERKECLQML